MATSVEQRLLNRRLIDDDTGCWLWTGSKNPEGYGVIRVEGSLYKVHRFAAVLWMQLEDEPNTKVLHSCSAKDCFNPEHLYIGTQSDNMRDVSRKRQGGKKLTYDQVRRIRALHMEGISMNNLAREFHVSSRTISMIVKRETFVEVE